MIRQILIGSFIVFFALSESSWAEESGSRGNPCSSIASDKDIVRCALAMAPSVVRARKRRDQLIENEDWASQIPNPRFNLIGTTGRSLGDNIIEGEMSLVQPLEIGGRRGARVDVAESRTKMGNATLLARQEEVTVATVSNLYRLKQLLVEKEIVEEAIHTFKKIIRQYKSRVKLGPERRVSLNVFQLSKSDYELRLTTLAQEEARLNQFFRLHTGLTPKVVHANLPKSVEWPDITVSSYAGSQFRLASSNVNLAQSNHELAKSLSWPNLNIGPVVGYESNGGISFPKYGVSVSFALPLLNQNGGQRAFTRSGILAAETNLQIRNKELETENARLTQIYKSSVDVIRSVPKTVNLRRDHEKLEKLFFRGLVSAPLVVEAHRQIVDYTSDRHVHEIRARQALWKLFALKGTLMEEVKNEDYK